MYFPYEALGKLKISVSLTPARAWASISVYNTCTLLQNNVKYVDANLDAINNAISGNEPSSEMLTSQSQLHEWDKTGNAKECNIGLYEYSSPKNYR